MARPRRSHADRAAAYWDARQAVIKGFIDGRRRSRSDAGLSASERVAARRGFGGHHNSRHALPLNRNPIPSTTNMSALETAPLSSQLVG